MSVQTTERKVVERWLPEWFTGWIWVGLAPQLALPIAFLLRGGVHDDRFIYVAPFALIGVATLFLSPVWAVLGVALGYRNRASLSAIRTSEVVALLLVAADALLALLFGLLG